MLCDACSCNMDPRTPSEDRVHVITAHTAPRPRSRGIRFHENRTQRAFYDVYAEKFRVTVDFIHSKVIARYNRERSRVTVKV